MNTDQYLDRLLARYAGTFDIYMPYQIKQEIYPAYAYFNSSVEKYVLSREAKLWTSDSFEHVLFLKLESNESDAMDTVNQLIREYMEPVLVRAGEKYPKPNHMYSYLTILLLTDQKIDPMLAKAVRKYSYEKGYLFNFRGYSQARIAAVSMEDEEIVLNRAGKDLKKVLQEVFEDVKANKKGFAQVCEEEKITPKTNL